MSGDSLLHTCVQEDNTDMCAAIVRETFQRGGVKLVKALVELQDQHGIEAVGYTRNEYVGHMLVEAGSPMREDWVVPLTKSGEKGHPCERVRMAAKKACRYYPTKEQEDADLKWWKRTF